MTNQLEVSNLLNPIIETYKAISDEMKALFEFGLDDYLNTQTEKYYFTYTFIHRGEKVRFNDIYFPVKSKYKNLITSFENIESIFEEYNKITIIGSAGSGKTTLVRHIFLNALKTSKKIPVLIELRNLNEFNGQFEDLLINKILKTKVMPSKLIFNRAIESGKFLFLFDGYDEIYSDKKQEINRQIELFVDSYPKNYFLISTRPGSGIENFPRFNDFRMQNLNDKDVSGFIEKIVDNNERKHRIRKNAFDPQNSNYIQYLRNPLLLSMFIMAFENHPEIPNRKSSFYRNVFDTLYSKHDGITKNSFPREKKTKLQRDEFEEILSIFSYLTLYEGKYSFTLEYLSDLILKIQKITDLSFTVENLIYDLHTSISILILDGFEYYFPHKSIQEYFAALFISKLQINKKQKAYDNLSKALEYSSNDFSFNFWSLCKELDETTFISYYLTPKLNDIYLKLEGKIGKELLEAYFNIIGPSLMIVSPDNKHISEFKIYRFASFNNSILEFCKAYNYDEIWSFPTIANINEELLNIQKKRKFTNSGTEDFGEFMYDKEVIDLFIKHGFNEKVEKIKNQIIEIINKWEADVNRKNSFIDILLDE
ncbi:NACHT domain-containing protein [Arundinibacter roseus]|uniref:NACHT domain-containing protein n=1 Tax=Arundinibacter roseus TaxID=2070510 RepID=A0A4R4KQ63_9BACT|nr:NACHT domain-containing protein [Arundinibacter roseus]TDB69086.1 NACHT domain-containing protein [Arundinibacter roseus]